MDHELNINNNFLLLINNNGNKIKILKNLRLDIINSINQIFVDLKEYNNQINKEKKYEQYSFQLGNNEERNESKQIHRSILQSVDKRGKNISDKQFRRNIIRHKQTDNNTRYTIISTDVAIKKRRNKSSIQEIRFSESERNNKHNQLNDRKRSDEGNSLSRNQESLLINKAKQIEDTEKINKQANNFIQSSTDKEKINDIEVLSEEAEDNSVKNFYNNGDTIYFGTSEEKYKQNINAIKLLNQLEKEKRYPTNKEKTILANYKGWGGLSFAFDKKNNKDKNDELMKLLSKEDYENARESTLTSFYTPIEIINKIYENILPYFDFNKNQKLKILEPSMGIGNFFSVLKNSDKNMN